ncbi:MAG: hypothetical protein QXJ59_04510 [Thermofilaceae archaeon]
MKHWQLLVYALGSAADFASTYAALALVPAAAELNPRVAQLLFTPLHPLAEAAAFTAMAAIYLVGFWLERFNSSRGRTRLGELERKLVHAAVAAVGAVRLAAAANNVLVIAVGA